MDETLRGECFAWFCEHPSASIRDAAENFSLSYETVREWSKQDQWHTRRTLSQYGDVPDDISEQAKLLRAVVVNKATSSDIGAAELGKLVDAFDSLAKFEPREEGIPRDLLDNM